jgi:serine protease
MSPYNFAGMPVLAQELDRRGDVARATDRMRPLSTTLASATALLLLAGGGSTAHAATSISGAHGFAPGRVVVKFEGANHGRALALAPGAAVRETVAALRGNSRVAYAEPDYVATASASPAGASFVLPNDPGTLDGAAEASATAGNWAFKQWNFLAPEGGETAGLPASPGGIDAVDAWRNLEEAGRPGAEGVTVAILDTGVAYRDFGGRFLRSPDFASGQFVPGYDFIDRDRLPLDRNGHGTHVAGTIGEKTDNAIGLTGLAYRAKLMPVRVLSRDGIGYASIISRGIRFAVAHGADVINMSFNFECGQRVTVVDEALRAAYAKGVVTVASGGNRRSETCVSEPATGPRVIGVGGTTEGGCLGEYALSGRAIDLVAPGGGVPAPGCASILARPIYQVTLRPDSTDEFGIPTKYTGTSMAAAHVSGVAAMVLASGVIKPRLSPKGRVDVVTRRLRATARSLGLPATQEGAGLIDAGRATDPGA